MIGNVQRVFHPVDPERKKTRRMVNFHQFCVVRPAFVQDLKFSVSFRKEIEIFGRFGLKSKGVLATVY